VLGGHARAVVVSMLLTWLLTGGVVVVILMMPALIQTLFAIPATAAARANSVATLALCLGCVCYGLLADRFGFRRVLMVGALALFGATVAPYLGVRSAPQHLIPPYALAGFCVGVVGVVPIAMVDALPPAIRSSGISFACNVAYAKSGGLIPLLIVWWLRSDVNVPVYDVAAACAAGVFAAWFGTRSDSPR